MGWTVNTTDSAMSTKPRITASDASLPTDGSMPTLWYTTSSARRLVIAATSLPANAPQNCSPTSVGLAMVPPDGEFVERTATSRASGQDADRGRRHDEQSEPE